MAAATRCRSSARHPGPVDLANPSTGQQMHALLLIERLRKEAAPPARCIPKPGSASPQDPASPRRHPPQAAPKGLPPNALSPSPSFSSQHSFTSPGDSLASSSASTPALGSPRARPPFPTSTSLSGPTNQRLAGEGPAQAPSSPGSRSRLARHCSWQEGEMPIAPRHAADCGAPFPHGHPRLLIKPTNSLEGGSPRSPGTPRLGAFPLRDTDLLCASPRALFSPRGVPPGGTLASPRGRLPAPGLQGPMSPRRPAIQLEHPDEEGDGVVIMALAPGCGAACPPCAVLPPPIHIAPRPICDWEASPRAFASPTGARRSPLAPPGTQCGLMSPRDGGTNDWGRGALQSPRTAAPCAPPRPGFAHVRARSGLGAQDLAALPAPGMRRARHGSSPQLQHYSEQWGHVVDCNTPGLCGPGGGPPREASGNAAPVGTPRSSVSRRAGLPWDEEAPSREGAGTPCSSRAVQRVFADTDSGSKSAPSSPTALGRGLRKLKKGLGGMGDMGKPNTASVLLPHHRSLESCYSLGRVIGQGQFGVIRLVEDRWNGARMACKTISKASLKSKRDVEDVRREHTVLKMLQLQPSVCHVEDVFEDAESVHFVMELCEGGDLFDRIKERKRYPEASGAVVLRTVLEVLQSCHERGIVHRDVKPENILLTSPGSDTDVKVIDFGIAAFATGSKPLSEIMGSLAYMAPEVLGGGYGCPADMWSVGVVLYVLLHGAPPFWSKTEAGIMKAIREDPIRFSRSKPISPGAKDLITKLINRDPSKRLTASEALRHPWISSFL